MQSENKQKMMGICYLKVLKVAMVDMVTRTNNYWHRRTLEGLKIFKLLLRAIRLLEYILLIKEQMS